MNLVDGSLVLDHQMQTVQWLKFLIRPQQIIQFQASQAIGIFTSYFWGPFHIIFILSVHLYFFAFFLGDFFFKLDIINHLSVYHIISFKVKLLGFSPSLSN